MQNVPQIKKIKIPALNLPKPIYPRAQLIDINKKSFFSNKRRREKSEPPLSFNKTIGDNDKFDKIPILLKSGTRIKSSRNTERSTKSINFDTNLLKSSDFKSFLTPRGAFSDYTIMNNTVFNRNMKAINIHEKKRLGLESLHIRNNIESSLAEKGGFITQRSIAYEEDETPVDIEKMKDLMVLGKFSFKYCFLRIRGRDSPLRVGWFLYEKNSF